MKNLNFKGIALALLVAAVWSCQTEGVALSETKSRVAPPDGVPSDYDEYLRLTTTDYYHLGKKITDTTEIKKLLLHAKVTSSEENRTDIYLTEDEARSLLDDHEKRMSEENQNKAASTSADNFMMYFYETSFKFWNDIGINKQIYYHKYQTIRGPVANYYTREINPHLYYGPTKKPATVPANGKTLSKMTEPHHPSEKFFSNLNFTINIFNPTRFTRRVVFEDQFGSKIFRTIGPKQKAAVGGYVNYTGYLTDGRSLRILTHYSYKL
jgi:hypothetical protein